MAKNFLISIFLLTLILTNVQLASAKTKHNILGLKVGMSKEQAQKILKKIGNLEKEERKQQQVWALTDNPHYSYIIIAYDKEYTEVRFITAKAREDGSRVRYGDVLDVRKARQADATNNYKYVLEVPPHGKNPGYTVTARGQDPNYLTYFSIEKLEKIEID